MTAENIASCTPYRVALYAAPPTDSEAWRRGSEWLGRCAWTEAAVPQPRIDGVACADLARWTAEPRRYGWHGTLKAPFRLGEGLVLDDLREAVRAICRAQPVFEGPPMAVARMGRFLAWRPATASPALQALADTCVTRLQVLAAPLREAELSRRRQAGLDPEADRLLRAWGYPWVLQRFRFHYSLTGPLDDVPPAAAGAIERAAEAHFSECAWERIDRLSLFVEPAPGADFVLLEQFGFEG